MQGLGFRVGMGGLRVSEFSFGIWGLVQPEALGPKPKPFLSGFELVGLWCV